MNLENIVASEITQSQKTTYCVVLFTWNVHNRGLYRNKTECSGCLELENIGDIMVGGEMAKIVVMIAQIWMY